MKFTISILDQEVFHFFILPCAHVIKDEDGIYLELSFLFFGVQFGLEF